MFYRLFQLIYSRVKKRKDINNGGCCCCFCTLKICIIKITQPYLSFALDCVTTRVCVAGVCVCVNVFCVSALLNLCPFRLLLAADSTLGLAVCQVSFMLPVSVDDELVPQVFNVTVSFPAL